MAGKQTEYPSLAALIGGTINVKHIRTHWDEILRLATSIRQGTVTASLMLRKLGGTGAFCEPQANQILRWSESSAYTAFVLGVKSFLPYPT